MKALLVCTLASLLAQAVLATAASADCDPPPAALPGFRIVDFPVASFCFTSVSLTDTDLDGFGNACDADYDQNCRVNVRDFRLFRAAFGTIGFGAPLFDHDEPPDGIVGIPDFVVFSFWYGAPYGAETH